MEFAKFSGEDMKKLKKAFKIAMWYAKKDEDRTLFSAWYDAVKSAIKRNEAEQEGVRKNNLDSELNGKEIE